MNTIASQAIDIYVDMRYFVGNALFALNRYIERLEPAWVSEFRDNTDSDSDTESESEDGPAPPRPRNGVYLDYSRWEDDDSYVNYVMGNYEDGVLISSVPYMMLAGGVYENPAGCRMVTQPKIENIVFVPETTYSNSGAEILRKLAGYKADFHGDGGMPTLDTLWDIFPEHFNKNITKIIVNTDNFDEFTIRGARAPLS